MAHTRHPIEPASSNRSDGQNRRAGLQTRQSGYHFNMLTLGLVLMLIGFVFALPALWSIGIVMALAGAILMLLGRSGRPVAGRHHYW